MEQKGKTWIIILVILLILSLAGAAVVGFYSFQKERLRTIQLDTELENLKVKERIGENKLAELVKRKDELNVKLEAEQTKIKELDAKLDNTEGEKNQLNSQIQILQSQLNNQEKIRNEWRAQQIQAKAKIDELQALLKESKDELSALSKELEAKKEVALGKIIVEQKETGREILSGKQVTAEEPSVEDVASMELSQPQDIAKIEGEVLVINRDYDFAVINLGSQDGIDVNDVFSVYHNDNYIGDIQVDKAQEIMSACAFISEGVKDKIREGDKVIRK